MANNKTQKEHIEKQFIHIWRKSPTVKDCIALEALLDAMPSEVKTCAGDAAYVVCFNNM